MLKVYGQEACEVVQPDGEVVPYVIRPVAAQPPAWRCWELTKADGSIYRVSEYPSGRWSCTCPHWKFRGRFKCEPGGDCDDKHIAAVREMLKPQTEVEEHGRPHEQT